jgi:hypothetical protein
MRGRIWTTRIAERYVGAERAEAMDGATSRSTTVSCA